MDQEPTGVIVLDRHPKPEIPKKPDDPLGIAIQRTLEQLHDKYKGDEIKKSLVSRIFQIIPALRGLGTRDPFPQDHIDKETMPTIQKDLIRSLVYSAGSDADPTFVHNTFTIAAILDSCAHVPLSSDISKQAKEYATKARQWWSSLKAEAAIALALQQEGYKVIIPEEGDVKSLDYKGGIDFLARYRQDDDRAYAIDAKSFFGMSYSHVGKRASGFIVEHEDLNTTADAMSIIQKMFPGCFFGKAKIHFDTSLLPRLQLTPLKDEQGALRTFLTPSDYVSKGISAKLRQLPTIK